MAPVPDGPAGATLETRGGGCAGPCEWCPFRGCTDCEYQAGSDTEDDALFRL